MDWVVVWDVDGDIRMRIPGTFHRCFRIANLLVSMPGPGMIYLQGI